MRHPRLAARKAFCIEQSSLNRAEEQRRGSWDEEARVSGGIA